MMTEPEKLWRQGAMSLMVSQIMTKAGKMLAAGNLKPAAQKQLAKIINDLRDTLPQLLSPAGPVNPAEVEKKLKALEGALDKLAAAAR